MLNHNVDNSAKGQYLMVSAGRDPVLVLVVAAIPASRIRLVLDRGPLLMMFIILGEEPHFKLLHGARESMNE